MDHARLLLKRIPWHHMAAGVEQHKRHVRCRVAWLERGSYIVLYTVDIHGRIETDMVGVGVASLEEQASK